ncbi:GNAT family N-acetyltransferase [Flavobacteriales bacterium]|nr:GNAT family N-acetyltransferase [Flavobacteriales bacterium]
MTTIQCSTFDDVDVCHTLLQECGEHLVSLGVFQWDSNYPDLETINQDVLNGEVFKLIVENRVLGCITLNEKQHPTYQTIDWSYHGKIGTVHRLGIHPQHQGNGYARQLMDFAEDWFLQAKFDAIRLDTYSLNHRNCKFYQSRGYQYTGQVHLREVGEPFNCYELKLR